MNESIGQKDIHGDFIHEGDVVHCWDGKLDQSEVTESLRGVVKIVEYSDETQYEVAGNNLALGCAQYVEIINQENK